MLSVIANRSERTEWAIDSNSLKNVTIINESTSESLGDISVVLLISWCRDLRWYFVSNTRSDLKYSTNSNLGTSSRCCCICSYYATIDCDTRNCIAINDETIIKFWRIKAEIKTVDFGVLLVRLFQTEPFELRTSKLSMTRVETCISKIDVWRT